MPPALRRLPRRETGRRPSPQPPHPRLRRPTGGGELGTAAMQGCGPGRPRAVGMGWGGAQRRGPPYRVPFEAETSAEGAVATQLVSPSPPPVGDDATAPAPGRGRPAASHWHRRLSGATGPGRPRLLQGGFLLAAAEPWLAAASGTFHLPSSCQVLTGLPLRGSAKWASHSDAVPGGPSPEGSKVQTSPTGRACGERACAAA